MTHQSLFFYGLFSLLSLLTLRGLYSLFLRIAKERSMSIDTQKRLIESGKKANRLTEFAVFGIVCFFAGWGARDLQQFHSTYVLSNVHVLQRVSTDSYRMETENHLPFVMKFCSDFRPNFEDGSLLKILVYEQRPECVSVSSKKLGYTVKRDEAGKPVKISSIR